MYNEIGNIFRTKKKTEVCVCAEIVWRISLRNLDQTLISPSSKIGLSWNLVSMFYSCSSWICTVGLSIGIPYGEFCSSEQGWAENKGENSSIAQVSSKRDISLICGPIGLKFVRTFFTHLQSVRLDCWSGFSVERYTPRTEHLSLYYSISCFTYWYSIL